MVETREWLWVDQRAEHLAGSTGGCLVGRWAASMVDLSAVRLVGQKAVLMAERKEQRKVEQMAGLKAGLTGHHWAGTWAEWKADQRVDYLAAQMAVRMAVKKVAPTVDSKAKHLVGWRVEMMVEKLARPMVGQTVASWVARKAGTWAAW